MRINGKKFKKYDDSYYISADGDVYSSYSKKILKHNIDIDGYHRVDIHGKHKKVHKLVFELWVRKLNKGEQVNHIDDNKNNNHYTNLYAGTQKENIRDQFKNNKRVGNIISITLYDSYIDEFITFPSVYEFIQYSGHNVANGSLSKIKKRSWFNKRYAFIRKKRVETIEQFKSLMKNYKKTLNDLDLVE